MHRLSEKYPPEICSKPKSDWDINIINVKIITELSRFCESTLKRERVHCNGDFMRNNIYPDFKLRLGQLGNTMKI